MKFLFYIILLKIKDVYRIIDKLLVFNEKILKGTKNF